MPRGRPKVLRVKVTCANCGKEAERYPSQIQRSKTGRFFCSKQCRETLGSKPQTIPRKTCELCGKRFVSYGRAPGRFCSKTCYDRWQRRDSVHLTCDGCGSEFVLSPSQAKLRAGNWCSRRCEAASRIKRPLNREHNGRPAVLDRNGYVRVYEPEHPRATKSGWQFEHRIIVERRLGRYLEPHEHVHHINGKKADNRLENLVAMGDHEHLLLSGQDYRAEIAAVREQLEEYRRRFGPLEP